MFMQNSEVLNQLNQLGLQTIAVEDGEIDELTNALKVSSLSSIIFAAKSSKIVFLQQHKISEDDTDLIGSQGLSNAKIGDLVGLTIAVPWDHLVLTYTNWESWWEKAIEKYDSEPSETKLERQRENLKEIMSQLPSAKEIAEYMLEKIVMLEEFPKMNEKNIKDKITSGLWKYGLEKGNDLFLPGAERLEFAKIIINELKEQVLKIFLEKKLTEENRRLDEFVNIAKDAKPTIKTAEKFYRAYGFELLPQTIFKIVKITKQSPASSSYK